jgi:2-haloacid dehalogenase
MEKVVTDVVSRFKTAYCTIWEKIRCDELFGEMDVTAAGFPEMARSIIAASQEGE